MFGLNIVSRDIFIFVTHTDHSQSFQFENGNHTLMRRQEVFNQVYFLFGLLGTRVTRLQRGATTTGSFTF